MKRSIVGLLVLMILGCVSYSFYLIFQNYTLARSPEQKVIIAYNSAYMKDAGFIMDAYKSVLEEEGVPYEATDITNLITTPAKVLSQTKPGIIFPDGLVKSMPEGTIPWLREYLNHGGNIFVSCDAGIQSSKGYFLEKAMLSDIAGINYITYATLGEKAFTYGNIRFSSEKESAFFQMPPGKTNEDNILTGYTYGALSYPVAVTELLKDRHETEVLAWAVTEQGEEFPAVTMKRHAKGNVLYVDLPLGYLKAYASDDMLLRSFIRTFLFKVVKVPHLLNTDGGTGVLVVNWHIDSSVEWTEIPDAIERNYLRKDLKYSIHVTAGDFLNEEGDGLGFDACGRGKDIAGLLLPYGEIGSHGGWAHNWFADNLENNRLSEEEITLYIEKNKTCLEELASYPLLEYSAPKGVYPQPVNTEILERLGFNSYYYTGDMGATPNRAFYNGKMVSEQVIAFPVQSLRKSASLYEMKQTGIPEEEVQEWLTGIVDYVIENRTTRLFYSHIYDIDNYPQALGMFLEYAAQKQAQGGLNVTSMSEIAAFLQRFLKTQYSFQETGGKLSITLKNESGLKNITVAVPRNRYVAEKDIAAAVTQDDDYYYFMVNEDVKEEIIIFDCI